MNNKVPSVNRYSFLFQGYDSEKFYCNCVYDSVILTTLKQYITDRRR